MGSSEPVPMTPHRLRLVAEALDLMSGVLLELPTVQSTPTLRQWLESDEMQVDLRRWADEMEVPDGI